MHILQGFDRNSDKSETYGGEKHSNDSKRIVWLIRVVFGVWEGGRSWTIERDQCDASEAAKHGKHFVEKYRVAQPKILNHRSKEWARAQHNCEDRQR